MEATKTVSHAEQSREIKKALTAEFGKGNVKVGHGTGTAWGWIEVKISGLKHKAGCESDGSPWCGAGNCQEISREARIKAEAIVRETVKAIGGRIYTYSDDMGGEHEEMIVDVKFSNV